MPFIPSSKIWGFLALAVILLSVSLTLLLVIKPPGKQPPEISQFDPGALHTVTVENSDELLEIFASLNYIWPPETAIPRIAVETLPRDLALLKTHRRKSVFLRILLPLVLADNARILAQRELLAAAFSSGVTTSDSKLLDEISELAKTYKVEGNINVKNTRQALLRRVDVIPHSLVLAQAALESGWGTSRFAQEANNLFGVWTWNPKEGLPPRRKSKDASHFVRKYENLRASVRSYLFNINVGHAYRDLRRSRAAMREQNQDIDVMQLAAELESYSERGEQYVEEVRIMIEYNRLALLTHAELAPDDQSLASVTNHGWLNQ